MTDPRAQVSGRHEGDPMTADVEKMVARLRWHALSDPHDEREVTHAPLLREAADLLESLLSETARLENARNGAVQLAERYRERLLDAERRLFAAEQAREQAVRDAYERAAKVCDWEVEGGRNDNDPKWSSCAEYLAEAIRALSQHEPSQDEPR